MADKSVANLSISNSYVGLLRISSDATGVSGTPATVYTSDGTKTVLSLGTSSAVINGSLSADYLDITNATTTNELVVVGDTTFGNRITFASDAKPGVINEAGVIFENRGTFKSTGTIISEGAANFTTLDCTGKVSVGSNFTITNFASFDFEQNQITFVKNFNCTETASFATVKLNNISVASGTGITVNSPTSFTGTLTTTNNTTLGGSLFVINATNTTFNKAVTFKNTVALGSNATASTQAANDNSTKVATTAYVDRATASAGSIPDYSNPVDLMWLAENTDYTMPCDAALTFGRTSGAHQFGSALYVNNQLILYWNLSDSHHGHNGGVATIIVGKGQVIKWSGHRNTMKYFKMK